MQRLDSPEVENAIDGKYVLYSDIEPVLEAARAVVCDAVAVGASPAIVKVELLNKLTEELEALDKEE